MKPRKKAVGAIRRLFFLLRQDLLKENLGCRYSKKNQENPTLDPDALAELLMLSAISLLVSELPDILITAIINPVGALCLIRRKTPAFRPQKPFAV
jgi:hypothetical protein